MSCQDCSSSPNSINNINLSSCGCPDACGVDSKCVVYAGPNLPCSGVQTGNTIEDALIQIDTQLCSITGDYSTFNTFCLAPITTPQEFVETISEFVCTLRNDFDSFVDTTFVSYQASVDSRFDAIENPAITCASAGITSADSLQTVYGKYCTKFQTIDTALNLSSVVWNSCFAVPITPTTIAGGFNTVLAQICSLNTLIGGGVSLPTFNNTGTCLPAPLTASDTLVDTVNKIKTRLCQTPTFDINALSWNCITQPSVVTTDIQAAISAILSKIDNISQNLPVFDLGQFAVTDVDSLNPCLGKSVALAGGPTTDKFVAVDAGDGSPSYLANKIVAGTNITVDTVTSPGTMIINSSTGAVADEKVKAFSGDPVAGFLVSKIVGGADSNGVSAGVNQDFVNNRLTVDMTVDLATLVSAILTEVANNPELLTQWCTVNASCPTPCSTPTNITVTFNSETTTTTTTT